MRIRLAGSMLGLVGALSLAAAACGGSSSSSSSTTTTTSTTVSTTAAAGAATGSTCAQANQIVQRLAQNVRPALNANPPNVGAVVQAVQAAVPQLQALASQASGTTATALNNLVGSLQSFVNGGSGPATSAAITNATNQFANSCR